MSHATPEARSIGPLTEALIATGQSDKALVHVERGLTQAKATASRKYVAKILALRGEIALAERAWDRSTADLAEALGIAREIAYPTLTWQCAHLLARAQAGLGKRQEALVSARLAADTIDTVVARIPDPALKGTFLAWTRVQAVKEDLDRFRRG